ncbi:hypothetical protein PIB30_093775 [Stylosanthes scabra]|uniref:Uncharacterized protein n=1 Tax=Stylosanthes scabra TaxID=79078 RepID=A0ABU6ZTY8_9FABA|nr:hypothetical protein [Stylosanthes scabra]
MASGRGGQQLVPDPDINRLNGSHHVAGAIGFQGERPEFNTRNSELVARAAAVRPSPTPGDIGDLPEVLPLLSTQLNGLGQISQDTHARRMLDFRNELDRFVWTPYMAPQWRVMEPRWVNEVGEIETWLATVPIVLFMYVRFHHVDRVKRQFWE